MRWTACILVLLCFHLAGAQSAADYWYFGTGIGVHFTAEGPQVLNDGAQTTVRAITSVSSNEGQLLFYSTDSLIWNRNHEVMPNGSGLFSSPYATQVRAVPLTDSTYALFTLNYESPVFPTSRASLYLSIIDMTIDGGLGDIDSSMKNIFLQDSLTTKLSAFRSCTDQGYWVVARSGVDKRVFAYQANSSGVMTTPVVSEGIVSPDPCCGTDQYGRFSPDGAYLLFAHSHPASIEFLEFDRTTGAVTPVFTIDSFGPSQFPYALEFSPNGNYLYASMEHTGQSLGTFVQYNLSLFDSATIVNSVDTLNQDTRIEAIQRAPNGKIYTSTHDSFLHVVHLPDSGFPACNFEFNGFPLQSFGVSTSLPTYDAGMVDNPVNHMVLCLGDTAFFHIGDTCIDALVWNFGDSAGGSGNTSTNFSPTHFYSSPGVYHVSLQTVINGDTLLRSGEIKVLNSALDGSVIDDSLELCIGSVLQAEFPDSLYTYLWSTGSDSITTQTDSTGLYTVTVTHPCFIAQDSSYVILQSPLSIHLDNTWICAGDSSSTPSFSFTPAQYLWSTGDTTETILLDTSLSPDLIPFELWLKATNACGSDSDTMLLTFVPLPDASLPPDSIQCFKEPVSIRRPDQDSTTFYWFDGSDDLVKVISVDTLIWLAATNTCGQDTDSMSITYYPAIQVELGKDTFLCPGDSVLLNAHSPGAEYLWTPGGSTQSNLTVLYEDLEPIGEVTYVVYITNGPCTLIESKKVSSINDHCDHSACKFSIPNVFTPNGDGINDVLRISNTCGNELMFRFHVYNRWGQLIHSGTSFHNRWDGTVQSEPAANGTYYIVIEYGDNSLHRSTCTLLR